MSNHHCKSPDRDAPGLECGYPLPCPHHTVVIDASDDDGEMSKLVTAMANIRYLAGRVHMSTYYGVTASEIQIRTIAWWSRSRAGDGAQRELETRLPLHSSLTEIRNAAEEQQLEARAWLEEHYSTPTQPVHADDLAELRERLVERPDAARERERVRRKLKRNDEHNRRPVLTNKEREIAASFMTPQQWGMNRDDRGVCRVCYARANMRCDQEEHRAHNEAF